MSEVGVYINVNKDMQLGLVVSLWPGGIVQLAHISFRSTPTTKIQPEC